METPQQYSKENPFPIYSTTETRFSFWDKMRVLFGYKVKITTTILADREVGIVKSTASTVITRK